MKNLILTDVLVLVGMACFIAGVDMQWGASWALMVTGFFAILTGEFLDLRR